MTHRSLSAMLPKVAMAVVGNALELYDFIVYGFSAGLIAQLFFPSEDPLVSLMATYGVFAAGFWSRPLGALLLGYVGDRYGRQRSLELSILLMLLPTTLMGLMPTYLTAGIAAPLILIGLRLLQGLSVGGELVSSYAYLYEEAPSGYRGLTASLAVVGCFAGKGLAALVTQGCIACFSEEMLLAWAWRVPFLMGLPIASLAIYLRFRGGHRLHSKTAVSQVPTPRLRDTLRLQWRAMLCVAGITVLNTVGVYALYSYIVVYLSTLGSFSYAEALTANLWTTLIAMLGCPLAGWLSDQWGRRRVMLMGCIWTLLLAYPCFQLMFSGGLLFAVLGQSCLAFGHCLCYAPSAALFMEIFPPQVRQIACGLAYNATVMTAGAFSPVIMTQLIQWSANPLSPAFYLIAAAGISALTLISLEAPAKQSIQEPAFT